MIKHNVVVLCSFVCFHKITTEQVGPVFDFDSSDFSKIVGTSAFVDKTLFIRNIIEINRTLLTTAPRGFGKSANLNMLKKFLELEVDEAGNPKTKANLMSDAVQDTENYKLFTDHCLKITEEESIMKHHFGKTPVISVTFKCEVGIKSAEDAVNFFRLIVHKAYRDHKYLLQSTKLGEDHKQLIDNWCDEKTFAMFGKHRVQSSLRELSEYLYRHFNERRVFVLIDDHDSVTRSAMTLISDEDEFDDVARLSVFIMNALTKNNKHISGGVITGLSDIPLFGSAVYNPDDPECHLKFKFLDDHRLVEFYGFTREEVDELLVYPKLKLGEHVVKDVRARYNGYQSKGGKSVYNPFSVLNFLQTGEFKNFWTNFNAKEALKEVMKISIVQEFLEKLLKGETIDVEILDQPKVDDLIDLSKLLTDPQDQPEYIVTAQLFSFLMDEGFLTYVHTTKPEGDKRPVKFPNSEIMEYFSECLNSDGLESI